ncbi:hypothetical protein NQZ79_g5585 [Umbelopsis isabellina]|nr:hypothetical protein NQZ79_g5585 [Umbelopsis isabellina]
MRQLLRGATITALVKAQYTYWVQFTDGKGNCYMPGIYDSTRTCFCVKNIRTDQIASTNGGTLKLFSSSDCTGNYESVPLHQEISNAEWVNSFSLGPAGSSMGPSGCPKTMPYC